jgi:hypothetical protein
MSKSALLASTAIGLLLCIAPAGAQMQQKGSEEERSPNKDQLVHGKWMQEITNSGRSTR